jgi:tetratricopeptide (TPR) repeat protein
VSLLMDALRKAELAKQQGQAYPSSAGDPSLSLEPAATADSPAVPDGAQSPSAAPSPTGLPDLSKLEDLDAEFIAHARRQSHQRPGTAPERQTQPSGTPARSALPAATTDAASDREAIRNAFAVKKSSGSSKQFLVIAAATGLLAVGAFGVYFWLQLKPVQNLAAQRPDATRDPSALAAPQTPTPAGQIRPTAQASSLVAAAPTAPAQVSRSAPRTAVPTERALRAALSQSAAQGGDTPIRITTSHLRVDPAVAEAYDLLQAGNVTAARTAYERLLSTDPRNAEALHGIAAIALRQGKPAEAQAAFLRILEANPSDPAAQAGLIGLNGQIDPVAGESRMKSLLAAQGEMPVVSFALGNLYARQERWSEAQQAYFNAVTADAGNPDYLFNLAISLDQLHQPKLAAQYYGQALAAAESRPAAFNRAQAVRRAHELQP